jgi:phage pi2 protein 07
MPQDQPHPYKQFLNQRINYQELPFLIQLIQTPLVLLPLVDKHLIYFEGLSDYKKSKDIKDGECRTQSFKKEESSSSLNIPNDKVLVDKDLYTKIYSFYQQNFISEYTSNKIDEYIEKVKELEELEDNLLSSLVEYSENCIENSFSKYEDSEIVKSFLDRVLIYKANKVLTLDSKIFEKIN